MVKRRSYKKSRSKRRGIRKRTALYKNKSFWGFLLGVVVGGAAVYVFIYSDIFQVKKIEISGNQKVLSENLQSAIEPLLERKIIRETKSLFLVNVKEIEKKIIKEFPELEIVNLKRKLPGILIVEAEERRKVLMLCQSLNRSISDDCFSVDKEGVAFERTNGKEGILVYVEKDRISLGERAIEKEELLSILDVYKGLEKNESIGIDKLFLFENRFVVLTTNGFDIYFNLDNDISDQIFNLSLVLEEEIFPQKNKNLEYIDLRFNNRVYYK